MRRSAKDIDGDELLNWIYDRSHTITKDWHAGSLPHWVFCWDFQESPWSSWPYAVVNAKLERLRRRGLLDGCSCGCRGDWELTDAGYQHIDRAPNPWIGMEEL